MFELNDQELEMVAGGKGKKASHSHKVTGSGKANFGGKGVAYTNATSGADGSAGVEALAVGTKNGSASSSLDLSDDTSSEG
ncbi:hypothetical protein EPA93_08600 [Ktedonosporobacter rubrisoli]|uniref:Bacteriocin n=1 Tax=Ktedonosporobacter rubrisoli TaxID=2509675 RepID=A0A4V0YYF7_KTERU|nr:hypothetical protein [Ktedonosporobacter rubrisoli]QBD76061.1 hypothetical protein EPA93_08600 [Ktedonosporobacter rubrisoli]